MRETRKEQINKNK